MHTPYSIHNGHCTRIPQAHGNMGMAQVPKPTDLNLLTGLTGPAHEQGWHFTGWPSCSSSCAAHVQLSLLLASF